MSGHSTPLPAAGKTCVDGPPESSRAARRAGRGAGHDDEGGGDHSKADKGLAREDLARSDAISDRRSCLRGDQLARPCLWCPSRAERIGLPSRRPVALELEASARAARSMAAGNLLVDMVTIRDHTYRSSTPIERPLWGITTPLISDRDGEGFRMPSGVRKPPKHEPAGVRRRSMGISVFGRAW